MSSHDYIKPGAFVRLRDGTKAEIYSTDNGGDYPVHGRYFCQSGKADAETWTSDGWRLYGESGHSKDITGPWVERPDYSKVWPLLPHWIKWLAQNPTGELFGYQIKPTPSHFGWGGVASFCYIWIPPEYHPPAIGDWKDSLQERPTP